MTEGELEKMRTPPPCGVREHGGLSGDGSGGYGKSRGNYRLGFRLTSTFSSPSQPTLANIR